MSTEMYPLTGLIADQRVLQLSRVITDEFDSGESDARRYWPAATFRRRFTLRHTHLTVQEQDALQRFYERRSGRFDSFFYRDNINRRGNVLVRFGRDLELPRRQAATSEPEVILEETAAVRALPCLEDVEEAAGLTPLFWLDANREIYATVLEGPATEPSAWDVLETYPPVWTGDLNLEDTLASQYQAYGTGGTERALSASNVSGLVGTQPAVTLFALVKHPTISARQVVFSIGPKSSGAALGLEVSAANYYQPFLGGSESWTNAKQSNATNNTWRSVAVVFASASNNASLYVNGALVGTDSNTRSLTAGKLALLAAQDGTLVSADGSLQNNCMAFAGALSLAQIKALHNLFAYQASLALV